MIPSTLPSFAQYSNDKTGLVDAIKDYSVNHFWESKVVDKCMTYNLSQPCWAKLVTDHDWGLGSVMRVVRNMNQYMMNNKGAQDLEAVEAANNSDRPNNQGRVDSMIGEMPASITFTLQADQIKCDATDWDLTHRFMTTVGENIADPGFKPKAGAAYITMIMNPKLKDLTVTIAPDGKHININCPTTEPANWGEKIRIGMHHASK